MSIIDRNRNAKDYVSGKLDLVTDWDESAFEALNNYPQYSETLTQLIETSAKGFRGVVATALTGKYLNSAYDPLNDFYSCNPRSIFEKGIYYAFENRVPCGKSDPLNVAKNINVLDEEWAKGKRPQSAAQSVVDFLRFVETASEEDQELLINFFFFRLCVYAKRVTSLPVEISETTEWSNLKLANAICELALSYPESGTIPQLVVGVLLKQVFEYSAISVEGGDESVFGTNTTSKKPADIWLELEGVPINLFEITVKVIDPKRLDDCIESLLALGIEDLPIQFICRMTHDIETLDEAKSGVMVHKGKTINFVDIGSFVMSLSALLTAAQIDATLHELKAFVERVDRPEKTKMGWKKIFG
jgi:hypothetical protein